MYGEQSKTQMPDITPVIPQQLETIKELINSLGNQAFSFKDIAERINPVMNMEKHNPIPDVQEKLVQYSMFAELDRIINSLKEISNRNSKTLDQFRNSLG